MGDKVEKPLKITEKSSEDREICRYLGSIDDPATAISYFSVNNCCYHADPVSVVGFEHQQRFCLSSDHVTCPVYQKESIEPFPKEYIYEGPGISKPRAWVPFVGLAGVLLLALVLGMLLKVFPVPFMQQNDLEPTVTQAAVIPPQNELPTMSKPSDTPTQLIATEAIATLSPTARTYHLLETPIGQDSRLVIHRLLEGEGVKLLALLYETTPEAILAVNYNLPPVLWVDSVIVIPVRTKDVSGLPRFSTYEVIEEGLTIEELAVSMQVNLGQLLRFNDLPEGYELSRGEWLLIPHAD